MLIIAAKSITRFFIINFTFYMILNDEITVSDFEIQNYIDYL